MTLSETEKLVLHADIVYDTSDEKIRYVNLKLGYLMEDGEVHPTFKRRSMKHDTYYRTLGTIKTKTTQRIFDIAKNFREQTLDEYELLLKLKKDKLQMSNIARGAGRLTEANRISDSVIAMLPYISAWRESLEEIGKEEMKYETKTDSSVPPQVFD